MRAHTTQNTNTHARPRPNFDRADAPTASRARPCRTPGPLAFPLDHAPGHSRREGRPGRERGARRCARRLGLDGRDHPEGVALGRMRAEVDAAHVAPAARRAEGEEGADDAAERHERVFKLLGCEIKSCVCGWVNRNRAPPVRSLCRVLCGCGRRLAGVRVYVAGFLGIVGLALPSTLMTSCGL